MNKKKVAAALAAVNLYLADEARSAAAVPLVAGPAGSGAWPHSGRESIMNLRQLVTMRLWRR
jgi:hypothetical protein